MPIATDGMDVIHVYPLVDQKDHETDGNRCWCVPEYEIRQDRMLVLHCDADHRAQWQSAVAESVSAVIQNAPTQM